jgi:hypothetical protein
MPSYIKPVRASFGSQQPHFPGALNASSNSAWSFGSLAPATPSPLRQAFTCSSFAVATSSQGALASSFNLKELSGDALDTAAENPTQLLTNVEVLRIFVQFDHIPFAPLDMLLEHSRTSESFRELHLCIQSQLRPALQDVQENLGLERALISTIRKWTASTTVIKFFFFPKVASISKDQDPDNHGEIAPNPNYKKFTKYQEVDLSTAIAGIAEASDEVHDILALAEGRFSVIPPLTSNAVVNDVGGDDMIDLDELR